ncbi:sodium channel modifier 1 [Canna indica]|uniref:Sodium channel modifier 1 n=1 Tax=Canna indica TaxID=4628 RepID=A0AAQ3KHM1_9LILI|nr:sodium channel modifier 1 [Canna indica]
MSTFGGDSWAREAQNRKRRVDDLMLSTSSSGDASSPSFKKLSSGKYACLVCSHNPILDTPLMLSIHNKGSRHIAAQSRVREKELVKQDELHKRTALSADACSLSSSSSSTLQAKHSGHHDKPLTQKTVKVILEAQSNVENPDVASTIHNSKTRSALCDPKFIPTNVIREPSGNVSLQSSMSNEKKLLMAGTADQKMLVDWHSELRKRQEKELKFTAAGWKRDCHGKWYKDENVEFDSDEEDPNITLR